MPTYSYKGYDFDVDHTPTAEEFQQMSAYVDSLPPKQTNISSNDAFEKNLLSPLMGLSRAAGALTKGGVGQESHAYAVEDAEKASKEHEYAAIGGKVTAALGPLVGALPLAVPSALGGALTGLGGVGGGIVAGAMAAPIIGPETGMERYQSLLNQGALENEATNAGITEGTLNAITNMVPVKGGGLVSRALQGAGINIGSGILNRGIQNQIVSNQKLHQKVLDPDSLLFDAIVGGVTEGIGGTRPGESLLAKSEKTTPKVKELESLLIEEANKKNIPISGYQRELFPIDETSTREMSKLREQAEAEAIGIQRDYDLGVNKQPDLFSDANMRNESFQEALNRWEQPEQARLQNPDRSYLKNMEEQEAWRQHEQTPSILHEEDLPAPLEPSQRSVEIESPQERTTYRSNELPPELRGQQELFGGFDAKRLAADLESIYKDLSGNKSFKAFQESVKASGINLSDQTLQRAYEHLNTISNVAYTTQRAHALGKIHPSFRESLSAYKDVSKEDALGALKVAPDFDKPSLGIGRDALMSRGRLGIEKLQNEGIKSTIAHMVGLRDSAKIKANQTLHGDTGVLRSMRKLETMLGQGRAWDVIKQRLDGQFNPDHVYNLDREQMKVKEQMDNLFDDIHSQMEQITGKKITKIPNYFPSMFYGDFVSEMRDPTGRLVGYITEKSEKGVREATKHILDTVHGQGFSVTEPKYRKEILNDKFKGRSGLAQHFEAMLELLTSDDPVVQKAQQAIQNAVAKRAMDTRQVKNRMKFKSGVMGAEGQKGWKTDRENYYAAKDVLENYVRGFEEWKANMETSKFLNEVKESMPDKKNSYNVLQDYFDDIRAVKDANNRMATKIDNAMSNAMGVGVGRITNEVGRGTANQLTKLWLGYWNPVAFAQNVLQPIHTLPKLVDLTAYGGSKDVISPMIIGFAKSLVDGVSIAGNKLSKTDLSERAKYLRDFEVIKPGLLEAKDKTKFGHIWEKNVSGGGQLLSEAFGRTTSFNIFSTYLEQSGYSKAEAYSLAKNLTHDYMVNYESYAKNGLISSAGAVGEFAGRLQSFKVNQFTQLANYIDTLKQTKNPAPLATALAMSIGMAGVSGMIGMDIAEGIYGVLVKTGLVEPTTRSPRQMAMDLGGAMATGLPTELSGKWLSGSLTTNLVGDMSWRNIAPIFAGTAQAFEQLPTVYKWTKDKVTGQHTVPNSEKAQALNTLLPTVVRGHIENQLLTDNRGMISSANTGEAIYQKGPQDDNLLSRFTNMRSKERGEAVARKALLTEQEKRIQEKIKGKTENLEKLFDEAVRSNGVLDSDHVAKQFQDLIDLGSDPKQTIATINKFIVKNQLGDWFEQQVASGKINLGTVQRKLRAMEEKEKMAK